MVHQAFDDAIDQAVLDQILKVENRLDLKNRKILVFGKIPIVLLGNRLLTSKSFP